MRKKILITGGNKNLGEFLSNYFIDNDYEVITISKKSKSRNGKVNSYNCDLSSNIKTLKILKKIKKKFSKIDFIISCAGESKKTFTYNESLSNWERAFQNNFFSFTNLVDGYLKTFKNNRNTKIVVISSIASIKITNAPITYSVAKSALNFYSQIKAKHLAKKKINLNIILPGNIMMKNNNWSKKIKKNPNKIKKYIKKNVPLNIFCNPIQIAEMCKYLFGKSGEGITGSIFTIDAGETL